MAARARSRGPFDYWPGFVDALSTLLLAIMFLLSVFVLAQFLLSREISGKDEVLTRLNSQINELTQLLALEKSNSQDAQDQLANLQASLEAAETERSRLEQLLSQGAGADTAAQERIGALSTDLDNEKAVSQRALSQVELLNQQIAALRKQIAALKKACAKRNDLCLPDADFLVDGQDYRISDIHVKEMSQQNDRARVEARFRNFDTAVVKVYSLVRENGRWVIDDIEDGQGGLMELLTPLPQ